VILPERSPGSGRILIFGEIPVEGSFRKMATRVVVSLDGAIVREVELSRPVMVVGRHPDCDIVLDHAAISMRHALFRVVNRTVYIEDLASTNGTLVNGIASSNQVLHHLDLIQVGMHKLHFFDDSLMAGGVTDLEKTVLSDYERTMLAASLPAEGGATQAARPAPAEPAQPAPRRHSAPSSLTAKARSGLSGTTASTTPRRDARPSARWRSAPRGDDEDISQSRVGYFSGSTSLFASLPVAANFSSIQRPPSASFPAVRSRLCSCRGRCRPEPRAAR